eukprot:1707_1
MSNPNLNKHSKIGLRVSVDCLTLKYVAALVEMLCHLTKVVIIIPGLKKCACNPHHFSLNAQSVIVTGLEMKCEIFCDCGTWYADFISGLESIGAHNKLYCEIANSKINIMEIISHIIKSL